MQDFSDSLPMKLYRALDAVMPPFRRLFSEFGLTETQWRVLRVLWEREAVPLGTLAACTLIPAPSLVGVVDRLSANGLVERRRSADDRRLVYVTATAAGRALEADVMPRVERAYATLRASIDRDVWQGLIEGLDAVAGTTRANDTDPSPSADPSTREHTGTRP